jgi:hypothetical protein
VIGMRSAEDISSDYQQNRVERKKLLEEWNISDAKWKNIYNIAGRKKLTTIQYLSCVGIAMIILIGMFIAMPTIQSYLMGPELSNDHVYSCPNGDWSGNTTEMIIHYESTGGVYLYCPIDGKMIGHMSKQYAPV